MKINLQLWSVKDDTAADFFGTLEKVAAMGYTGVEFAGFGGIPAEEMKKKLDELGLEGISAHVSYDLLTNELEETIAYLKTIGASYIICPGAKVNSVENAKEIAAEFNRIGRICRENGLIFGYHNHDFEFKKDQDQYPLEVLFDHVDPQYVVQQPDVFWVEYAGLDALDYLQKHRDRCPIIHLKQIKGKDNVDAQDGIIDFAAIKALCDQAVFVYEQEEYPTGTPLECVAHSAEHLTAL